MLLFNFRDVSEKLKTLKLQKKKLMSFCFEQKTVKQKNNGKNKTNGKNKNGKQKNGKKQKR